MPKRLSEIPVSVLDLATIVEGQNAADAFERSRSLAIEAERLGYTRYWFAEHHNMQSVASSATAVLIGFIASQTRKIRVGSGGIMLPNHAPLIIAEQFGTLASLYPGRIDLGIGRAPGTDPLTSRAIRRERLGSIEEFPNDVMELQAYLADADPLAKVRAVPGEGTKIPIWLLGSSTYSAHLAAILGLPFAFASHFSPAHLFEALSVYRANFRPSENLQHPYAMACVNVVAADTDEEANLHASSFYMLALGLVRNDRRPLPPPVENLNPLWTDAERLAVEQFTRYSFVGSVSSVKSQLENFVSQTGVNEIMVTSHVFDNTARIRSYQLIAPLLKTSSRSLQLQGLG